MVSTGLNFFLVYHGFEVIRVSLGTYYHYVTREKLLCVDLNSCRRCPPRLSEVAISENRFQLQFLDLLPTSISFFMNKGRAADPEQLAAPSTIDGYF